MKVSVLIVNWNGLDVLPACIDALRRQSHRPHQIVVVDNGSEDGSADWLRDQEGLTTRFLDENTGFSGGNNAGLPLLTGEVVALLNNDAEPQPDWIRAALPAFEDSCVGMVACKILRRQDPGVIDKAGHLIFPDGLNRGRGTGQPDDGRFDRREEALWPDGCAAFYRVSAIEETGFFDDDFFLYGEDADLGFRLRWAGYDCRYEPESVVLHGQSSSLGRFSPRKIYYIERNRWWVLVKNFPMPDLLFAPWHSFRRYVFNAWSMLRGRGSAASFQRDYSAWQLLTVFLRASWDGVKGLPRNWRKRRAMLRRTNPAEMRALIRRYRISAAEITLND